MSCYNFSQLFLSTIQVFSRAHCNSWPLEKVFDCYSKHWMFHMNTILLHWKTSWSFQVVELRIGYELDSLKKKKKGKRTSLAIQWLRLCTSTAGCTCLVLGQETKILHAMQHGKKNLKKKKDKLFTMIWSQLIKHFGVSALVSVLPMNIQCWLPLGLTG